MTARLAVEATDAGLGSKIIMTSEANSTNRYKNAIAACRPDDITPTEVYTDRPVPMHVKELRSSLRMFGQL